MAVKPSQACYGRFTVSDSANQGALVDADSLPTASLVENGTVDAAVVATVFNVSTGIYRWQFTVPADYTPGTIVQVQITATLHGNDVAGIVWSEVVDKYYLSNIAGSSYVEGTYALDQQVAVASVADAVFDEALAGHTTSGTAGAAIGNIPTSGAIADAVLDEALSGHTSAGTPGAALQYVYWVEFEFIAGTSTDKYRGVRWIKNGTRLTSGVTSPTIQVIDTDDGTDLIAETAMTEAGSSELFKYDATGSEVTTAGAAYRAVFTATIDGATRTYEKGFVRTS